MCPLPALSCASRCIEQDDCNIDFASDLNDKGDSRPLRAMIRLTNSFLRPYQPLSPVESTITFTCDLLTVENGTVSTFGPILMSASVPKRVSVGKDDS